MGSVWSPGGVPLGSAATPGPAGKRGHDALVDAQQRLGPERLIQHVRELRDQPGLAVVVVEHEDPVVSEVVADACEGLLGEQEGLEAEVGRRAHQRQGIGQREDDQVVLLVGVAQEGAAVVDVPRDARILVGAIRVLRDADGLDLGVDLDRVDVLGAVRQRLRHVAATAGPDDQHVVVRAAREPVVDLLVEGFLGR